MPNSSRDKKPRRRRRKRRTRKSHNVAEKETSLGRNLGGKIGGALGHFAEKSFRSLFGSGDYQVEHANQAGGFDVNENSIVSPLNASVPPEIIAEPSLTEGLMRVRHREFIRDVITGDAFTPVNLAYRINPCSRSTFPWLSSIAENFEQWVPHGIVFEFVSTCGNAVSSNAAPLGSVSLVTQYNVMAPRLRSKAQILNNYYAVSGKSSESLMHAVECDPSELPQRILWTQVSPGEGQTARPGDDRLYDLGYFTYYATGSLSQYTSGELWVTYDISLLKPRLDYPLPGEKVESIADWYREQHPSEFTIEGPDLDETKESPDPDQPPGGLPPSEDGDLLIVPSYLDRDAARDLGLLQKDQKSLRHLYARSVASSNDGRLLAR